MRKGLLGIAVGLALAMAGGVSANPVYGPPAGGWDYVFGGDSALPGDAHSVNGWNALDGTWSHFNGSDAWDGTEIGTDRPGGASALTEGGTTFLRIQDTGDPRDYGFSGDPSNRKLYFGHDITAEGAPGNVLDQGVTISMRARVATDPPLDDLHPDGGGGVAAWPAKGDGYLIHDGGKGNFGIVQANGGTISFSLATAADVGMPWGGLIMNNLNGSAVTGDVDSGEPGSLNMLLLADPTAWHEFWITIQADVSGGGTHRVDILADGLLMPFTFHVTAGNGAEGDFGGVSYLALGAGSTGQAGALDVDYVAWKAGVSQPIPEPGVVGLVLFGLGALIWRRRK